MPKGQTKRKLGGPSRREGTTPGGREYVAMRDTDGRKLTTIFTKQSPSSYGTIQKITSASRAGIPSKGAKVADRFGAGREKSKVVGRGPMKPIKKALKQP